MDDENPIMNYVDSPYELIELEGLYDEITEIDKRCAKRRSKYSKIYIVLMLLDCVLAYYVAPINMSWAGGLIAGGLWCYLFVLIFANGEQTDWEEKNRDRLWRFRE